MKFSVTIRESLEYNDCDKTPARVSNSSEICRRKSKY